MPIHQSSLKLVLIGVALFFPANLRADAAWPQFRGPTQQGWSDAVDLPTTWSETQNVKWKTAIPGKGWSSPVIMDRRVWMTTAANDGKSLRAICVDQASGKIVHDIEVFSVQQLDPKNDLNSYASPTPVLETGRVYVSFGTHGQACLDTVTGKVIWKNEDLKLNHMEGAGSSPILWGGYYILHCDGTDVQYVAMLDKTTGQLVRKLPRTFPLNTLGPHERKAFSIPTVVNIDGKEQLVTIGSHRVSGFDLADNKELWHSDLPGFSNVPRPVYGDGLLYISTGYMNAELWAIRPTVIEVDGAAQTVWKSNKGAPLKPSILFIDGAIYFASDVGIVRCLDAKTGEEIWKERVLRECSASPIYAGGVMYFFDEKGKCAVIRPGKKLDVVAENELDTRVMASPAAVGKALFVRTETHLYRIEK